MAYEKRDTLGLGFKPTEADRKWAKDRKKNKNSLVISKPIPHICKSLVKPMYEEDNEVFTEEDIEWKINQEKIRRDVSASYIFDTFSYGKVNY